MTTKPAQNPATQIIATQCGPDFGPVPEAMDSCDTYDGTLVGLSKDGLLISTREKQQHSFSVANDAYVCCDGVTCGIEKLKVGGRIRLTVCANDKHVATIIESLANQSDFADHH